MEERAKELIDKFNGSKVMSIWFQENFIEYLFTDYNTISEFQNQVLIELKKS